MKLKLALPAVFLAVVLTGCGPPPTTVIESPKATTPPVNSELTKATELTAEWNQLDYSEFELPNESTDNFSKAQVKMVAEDVIGLLENQLKYQQAESRGEVIEDVDDFIASAPGALAASLLDRKKHGIQNGKDTWPTVYVQEVDSTYKLEDESRSTYAWKVKEKSMFDTKGIAVTVFHRSFYRMKEPGQQANFITVGRWIELSTIDPDYASWSKDYAWHLGYAYNGADVCELTQASLLVPTPDKTEKDEALQLVNVPTTSFAPESKFKVDQEALEAAAKKC